ncbi:hypothetical protein ACWEQA_23985 [Nocardia sp. NPDC004085]
MAGVGIAGHHKFCLLRGIGVGSGRWGGLRCEDREHRVQVVVEAAKEVGEEAVDGFGVGGGVGCVVQAALVLDGGQPHAPWGVVGPCLRPHLDPGGVSEVVVAHGDRQIAGEVGCEDAAVGDEFVDDASSGAAPASPNSSCAKAEMRRGCPSPTAGGGSTSSASKTPFMGFSRMIG